MGKKRRKRPGRHTVHTKDPRYNVNQYPRGSGDLVTRHGVNRPPDYSKSTIIYANSEAEAQNKVEDRFGAVKKVEYMGKNDMGNPYYRVTFIPTRHEFDEFKNYIAISPNARELRLTEKEIVKHPRLTEAQKKTLYQHIRARTGNLPTNKRRKKTIETSQGTAYYLHTEVEGPRGTWDDHWKTTDGYWVIHRGNEHDVYSTNERHKPRRKKGRKK